MIPVKLELYNFLAYHQPEPLNFSGIHVACLAGENGAGKSSLLEAITWALWGKARVRRDDELIHMHRTTQQTEMSVTLTFRQGGELYKVIRYRSSKGRGSSELQLSIKDGEKWRSISENHIRDTQEKINRLLRLDYDTFINSAYLIQGRADEFTEKTSAQRKEILGEILGISSWKFYEERVKEQQKQAAAQINQIDGQITSIENELAREPQFKNELETAKVNLDSLISEREEVEAQTTILDQVHRAYQGQLAAFNESERNLNNTRDDLNEVLAEQEKLEGRIEEFNTIIATGEDIEGGYATLLETRQQEKTYSANLIAHTDLHKQMTELQRTIDAAHSQVESDLRASRTTHTNLQRDLVTDDDYSEIEEVTARIAELEDIQAQAAEWQTELNNLIETRASLEATNTSLYTEMHAIKEQKETIEATTEPECPLCGQELSAEHRTALVKKLQNDGTSKGDEYRANKKRLEDLQDEEKQLRKRIVDAEPNSRNLPALHGREAELRSRLERAEKSAQEIQQAEEEIQQLEAKLEQQDYALEAQQTLASLESQLAKIGYDEATHRELQAQITDYEEFEALKAQLDRASESITESQERIANLVKRRELLEQRYTEGFEHYEALRVEIAQLEEQLIDYKSLRARLADLRDREGNARYIVGAAEQRLNNLDNLRHRREELMAQREEVAFQQGIFEELRTAFGRDGIPAMIIEAAIPEIEKEANLILGDMTDGRMHIQFDTQRENVTGGTRETLDIRISDELGTRDYELYSGGESFRVNFAIRLALSRILARRAGAQLRTLIIDEGFGTQDAQGRERLVQAINAIQKDFDLVLVITHIEELKEAFPVQIEITKTPTGSQIEIR